MRDDILVEENFHCVIRPRSWLSIHILAGIYLVWLPLGKALFVWFLTYYVLGQFFLIPAVCACAESRIPSCLDLFSSALPCNDQEISSAVFWTKLEDEGGTIITGTVDWMRFSLDAEAMSYCVDVSPRVTALGLWRLSSSLLVSGLV